jgi:hypothetical protein
MPGFLGGSSSGSGTGGEISFPKEFIDPVTKLRVSTPENLIDTDFEYGLQPTKWETVELINNTPSFFSKSGDTTIPDIIAITTNAGTREITVTTALPHGLAVGIPINVTGTKSVTADGSFIINSIPNTTTFTYLCKDNQIGTSSIEDLYSSIITGEFFQGSQLRISDDAGITTDGESISTLTVTTDSTHGFGVNTPFYFLNLNSTIAQEFAAANTETKAFDSSNSATAQTFDGSNTLSTVNIDWSNSAVVGGTESTISSVNVIDDTITVSHGVENFSEKPIGTPLYHNVVASTGYFADNPRGVVFLKSDTSLGTSTSTFEVSAVPDGTKIDIEVSMTGTFQLANQARTFAGNNLNPLTQTTVTLINDAAQTFDGANTTGETGTVTGFSGSNVTVTSASALQDEWYSGAMVLYQTTGSAASGLANNTTYWLDTFFQQGSSSNYTFTLKTLPNSSVITSISGGTGTQTFKKIGVSVDKDIFHLKNNGFAQYDMLKYDFPVDGRFTVATADEIKNYYFVQLVYDQHNFTLNQTVGELQPLTISREGGFTFTAITPTTVTPVGLTAPIVYSITQGPLPTGLNLNTSTGVISGTPTEVIAVPGRTVIVTATDATGSTAFQTVQFQFNPAPQLYEFSSAQFNSGGASERIGPNISQARSGVGNPSWAATYLNMNVNGVMLWTVPRTGTYRIQTYGASGGWSNNWGQRGGYGAGNRGDFSFTQGQVLKLMVGQRGRNDYYDGSGGGGTGVATSNNSALIISGGGGGGGPGGAEHRDSYGNQTAGRAGAWGQANGGNGGPSSSTPGGGGGFFNNGGGSWPGQSFINGGVGGPGYAGGFGAGGGGAGGGTNGAGGGGGYSGGGAYPWSQAGAGGGSINNGSNQANANTANSGVGYITITRL